MAVVKFRDFSVKTRRENRMLCDSFTGCWASGERGLTIGLMGRSGIGKTCFLKALVGLPDNGTLVSGGVTFDALPSAKARAAGRLGMAFQQPGIVPWLTVRQNIEISGLTKPETVEKLLSWLDLEDRAEVKAGRCSGGQQSRVSFARSLAHEPGVLILDEPFTGVDLVTKKMMLDCIEHQGVFGKKLVVLVTHDVVEVCRLASELWVLGDQADAAGNPRLHRVKARADDEEGWTVPALEKAAIEALTRHGMA